VQLEVTNGPGNPTDFIGLFASGATDLQHLDWKYLNGSRTAPASGLTTATVTFTMPATAGTYTFRFFRNGTYDKIATSTPVTVEASDPPTLRVISSPRYRGLPVRVAVENGPGTPTDWVGLYAASGADANPIRWKYLNGAQTPPTQGLTDATLIFRLAVPAGGYNFRFFRNGSLEKLATSETFVVR